MNLKGLRFTFFKQERKIIPKDDISAEETDTISIAVSDDGLFDENEDEYERLEQHPGESRRKRTQRVACSTLVVFFIVMGGVLTSLRHRKSKEGRFPSDHADQGSLQPNVYCSGKLTFTLDEWLKEDLIDSAGLCDPDFQPESSEAQIRKPVKVFLMLGETNMIGAGQISGDLPGTLEYTVKSKKRFTHLVDSSTKAWIRRSDVRYVAVKDNMDIVRNEWLGVDERYNYFGPELQFGYILGELLHEPVLLLKASSGPHSLGGDMLPPGSSRYEVGGWIYAGYGDSPRRWPSTIAHPPTNSWHAGHAYNSTLVNIKTILSRINDYYPGATSYEVAGIAFWQGETDRRDSAYAGMYRRNLRDFIVRIRNDLHASGAKFAIATLGQRGQDMSGNTLQIHDYQMEVGSMFPDFKGNVISADIQSSWRTPYTPGHEGNEDFENAAHYGNHAETFMEVGNALGLAMAKLLFGVE